MKGYQLVLDHPCFAVSDAQGAFHIRGLPPDTFEFRTWHECARTLEKNLSIEVKPGEVTELLWVYHPSRFVK